MKYTLITWASSGVWKACAHWFAKTGASLILAARSSQKLEDIKSEILNHSKVKVICKTLDVTDANAVDSFFLELQNDDILLLHTLRGDNIKFDTPAIVHILQGALDHAFLPGLHAPSWKLHLSEIWGALPSVLQRAAAAKLKNAMFMFKPSFFAAEGCNDGCR